MAEHHDPPHASDEALAAYALRQGESRADADDEEARHIGACAECQAEVAHIEWLASQLDHQLYRLECPPVEQLTAYALGELHGAERRRVTMHVRGCGRCTDDVAVTRSVLASTDAAGVLAAALRRVLAVLMPPPTALAPALSLRDLQRPEEDTAPRIFVAEGVEITLRSEVKRGQSVLYGAITSEEDAATVPISVRLVQAPAEATSDTETEPHVVATADVYLDAFELGPVRSGTYQLEVLLADRVIVLPLLTL